MCRNAKRMETILSATGSGSGSGRGRCMFAETRLIGVHGKAGRMWMAWDVFRRMQERDAVAWNALIAVYASSHDYIITAQALLMFSHMQHNGFLPDEATFMSVLRACGRLGILEHVYDVHSLMVMVGTRVPEDVGVCNMLIHVYAQCGSMCDACGVFLCMPSVHTVVSWTAIISGFAKLGQGKEALSFFHHMMKCTYVEPDEVTFLSALHASALIGDLEEGRRLHAAIMEQSKVNWTLSIDNALIHMYAKCGSMEHAIEVFNQMTQKDVVSWTALIVGCMKHGSYTKALNLYERMSPEGVLPNDVTFLCIMNACAGLADLGQGEMIHDYILKINIQPNVRIESALVDMYAKCGCLENARDVFHKSKAKDSVAINAMISGHIQNEAMDEAYKLFRRMPEEGLVPDVGTFLNALSLCASLVSLDKGKEIHVCISTGRFSSDFRIRTALIDMYCKCGDLPNARKVFNFYHNMDLILWAAQLSGYAQHGMYKEAHQAVDKMFCEGLHLNDVCFLGLITACGHEGDVEEGCVLFLSMTRLYEIRPRLEHYTCIIDMLSRAGRLEEGVCIMEEMSYMPTTEIWFALLGSCRIHGNLKLAERVSECIWMLDPENTSASRLLATTYKRFAGAHLF